MSKSGLPLGGQAAIVTGSSRNIGRASALALAADGASRVINARNDNEGADAVVAEIDPKPIDFLHSHAPSSRVCADGGERRRSCPASQ